MEKIRGLLAIFLLLCVGACGAPLTQQALTPTERAIATELVGKIAGKSFVGQWGSGNRTVDIQIGFGPDFVFDVSGGGQEVHLIRDTGAPKPLSDFFPVISMRLDHTGSVSMVLTGIAGVTYTISFATPPDKQILGRATSWTPVHNMSWSSPLRQGVLDQPSNGVEASTS